MSTPFFAANAAYGQVQKLVQNPVKPVVDPATQGAGAPDFGKLVAESVQSVVDTGRKSDQLSMDMVNGNANVVDVVTAVSQTELAIDSLVTVRDKVISAYEQIMSMPI